MRRLVPIQSADGHALYRRFVIGWFQARRRNADAHHWLMLGGMMSMLSFFVAYYLFRQLGVLAVEERRVRWLAIAL
ncbi:MAG: hypothetical protein U0236_09600 [Nitrospira sp.]